MQIIAYFFINICTYAKKAVLRPSPPSKMGTPSKVQSHFAGYINKGGDFFCRARRLPILHAYISSYASIAAIYSCKIDRILFYSAKKISECLHICKNCCTFAAKM